MSGLLDLALGPVFRATLLFLALGLCREAVLRLLPRLVPALVTGTTGAGGRVAIAAPLGGLRSPARIAALLAACTVLLLASSGNHLLLLRGTLPRSLPHLDPVAAEVLAFATLGALGIALATRARRRRSGAELPRRHDLALGLLALAILLGLLARHPEVSPVPYRTALLLHVLAAEAFFVAVPLAIAGRRTAAEEARP